MAISLICTCGARFAVDDGYADREILCPECQQVLKVPASGEPVARVSKLALFSFVLALVGAFTVIGTGIAALLGLIACGRILLRRPRLVGLPFALAGVFLGVGLTVLTTLALAGDYLKNLGNVYREALLADQLDPIGEPVLHRGDRGFLLSRPDTTWGLARRNRLDDEFVDALRFRRSPELLLVQPARFLLVDVRRDTIEPGITLGVIQNGYFERMRWKEAADDWEGRPWDRWNDRQKDPGVQRWNPLDAEEAGDPGRPAPLPVDSVRELGSRERTVRNERDQVLPEAAGLEVAAEVRIRGKSWRLLIHFYRVGEVVFIVRGYAPSARFTSSEEELRRILDSFRVTRELK